MLRLAKGLPALGLVVALSHTIGLANGIPAPAPPKPAARTPEARAVEAYNSGLGHRNRAMKAQAQAARSTKDADRAKHELKSRDEYMRALAKFQEAATLDPSLPQAWNGLGFARRQLGEYEKSLAAYDRALALAPNFPDALEYRGETYLAMNRVEEAKQDYLAVFAIDRRQAELLMNAMAAWVARRKAEPAGVLPGVVSELETWIRERAAIAQQTRLMGLERVQRSW